jgi:hypothetical protein
MSVSTSPTSTATLVTGAHDPSIDADARGSQVDLSSGPEGPPRESVDDEWGRSESFDPDNVGDIADEGAGHRG